MECGFRFFYFQAGGYRHVVVVPDEGQWQLKGISELLPWQKVILSNLHLRLKDFTDAR